MGYLQIINTPAHEMDTLWTGIGQSLLITHKLNAGQSTVLTFIEQLYAKVKGLQWVSRRFPHHQEFLESHQTTLRRFQSTRDMVWKFRLWWEPRIQQHGSKIVQPHHQSTKLTVDVLWHIMWPNFPACDQALGIGEDLHRLSEEVAMSMDDSGDLGWPSNSTETLKIL